MLSLLAAAHGTQKGATRTLLQYPCWRKARVTTFLQVLRSIGHNDTLGPVSALLHSSLGAEYVGVSGRVIDPSGAVVPGVSLELRNSATGIKISTTTNGEGVHVFPPVAPGGYEVSARAAGFSTTELTGMTLEVGQFRTLNLTLTPSPVSQSVTVSDEAPLLTVSRADRGTVVENQFVLSIPLNTRNPLLLMGLTAGVVPGNVLVPGDNTVSQGPDE